jgi:hypothetical protein
VTTYPGWDTFEVPRRKPPVSRPSEVFARDRFSKASHTLEGIKTFFRAEAKHKRNSSESDSRHGVAEAMTTRDAQKRRETL